jgi:hypothetical protein
MPTLRVVAITLAIGAPLCVWTHAPWYAAFSIGVLIAILLDIWEATCNR